MTFQSLNEGSEMFKEGIARVPVSEPREVRFTSTDALFHVNLDIADCAINSMVVVPFKSPV
jgi:hypothetical protein